MSRDAVEAVARAIAPKAEYPHLWNSEARAAIAEVFRLLREPSEGMVAAGDAFAERAEHDSHQGTMDAIWYTDLLRAMLAEAEREWLGDLSTPDGG